MQIDWKKYLLNLAFVCWGLFFAVHVNADVVTYQATTDFPVIDAGEVPYYVDEGRQALAINAANVEFRDRFAKAEVVFDGQPGIYQIALVALAENDGEADFRLSINGEIVGLASNPEVDELFLLVRHQFADINLPAGAVIGVESLANSNGKIPENDEFAFARGRWTAIELSISESVDTVSDPDLSIVANFAEQGLRVGDNVDVDISVNNATNTDVATGVVVSLSLPADLLELVDQSVCNIVADGFECAVAELPADGVVELTANLRAIAEVSNAPLNVSVTSDQIEFNGADNAVELDLSINAASDSAPEVTTEPTPEVTTESTPESTPGSTPGSTDSDNATDNAEDIASDSGGGAFSFLMLLGLATSLLIRRHRRQNAG